MEKDNKSLLYATIMDLGAFIKDFEITKKDYHLMFLNNLLTRLRELVDISLGCKECISPSVMKDRGINPCLHCGADYKYYLTQDGKTNRPKLKIEFDSRVNKSKIKFDFFEIEE